MIVYLQYPWKFPDSPYYKYLIDNSPKEIFYLNIKRERGVITNIKMFKALTKIKSKIRKFADTFKLPIPNAHFTKSLKNYDLIHCAHCLSLNRGPWVADMESVWSMWIGGKNTRLGRYLVGKILRSKSCKKIMPWTRRTEKEILEIYPDLKDKLEIVYPAVPVQNFIKKRDKKITILYATRHFYLKGGLVALEVFSELKRKYGDKIELIFVSDNCSEDLKDKYPLINIQGMVSSEKLREYYKKADIFFYPSFVDTFGFAILEAMSYGLPIVSIENDEIRKELIEDGKNGFLVKTHLKWKDQSKKKSYKLIKDLIKLFELLINDVNLQKKISKFNIEEIKNGKFSIKRRNKKLKRIYEEAIKV
jgi:glycosyltransferase involved in cell wall biosynthesis